MSIALVIVAVPANASGSPPLSLDVQPSVCADPCAVQVNITLAPHEYDRALIVEADSAGFYGSSLIQLDGEAEPSHVRLSSQ
jgi:hypothetical protein